MTLLHHRVKVLIDWYSFPLIRAIGQMIIEKESSRSLDTSLLCPHCIAVPQFSQIIRINYQCSPSLLVQGMKNTKWSDGSLKSQVSRIMTVFLSGSTPPWDTKISNSRSQGHWDEPLLPLLLPDPEFRLLVRLYHILTTAAAAKLLQSCPTLNDPMECSLPGFSIHGIFQARVLEWAAIAFSDINHWYITNPVECQLSLAGCWLQAIPINKFSSGILTVLLSQPLLGYKDCKTSEFYGCELTAAFLLPANEFFDLRWCPNLN